MIAGTTIVLAVPCENMFFTEHVVRHFQRTTNDRVNLLLITNDQTSNDVRELAHFLAEHPRTEICRTLGCRDLPIGKSIDHAIAQFVGLRERLLFTHMDLFYREPKFWECETFVDTVHLASGPFVQQPLWHLDEPKPIPRPADDHILIDTKFYLDNELVFRAYAQVGDALNHAPWLRSAYPDFRTADGKAITEAFPLDPFNLSHLKLSHRYGPAYHSMWTYHYPRQSHFASVLRVFQAGVKRVDVDGVQRLWVPNSVRPLDGGYHWRSILRYAIVSSHFFNPLLDYIIPVDAMRRLDPMGTQFELDRLGEHLEFLRAVTGNLPYRVVGEEPVPAFELRVWDDSI